MRIFKLVVLFLMILLVPVNYSAKDKVKIILFRSNDCIHCKEVVEFFNSIEDEYGQYFEVDDYEVFENSKNNRLKKKVAKYFNEDAPGVPYIIIGKATFYGYSEELNDDIIKAIMNEYNNDNRIDIISEASKFRLDDMFLILFLVGIGGFVTFLCYGKK